MYKSVTLELGKFWKNGGRKEEEHKLYSNRIYFDFKGRVTRRVAKSLSKIRALKKELVVSQVYWATVIAIGTMLPHTIFTAKQLHLNF